MNLIQQLEQRDCSFEQEIPEFAPGDTVVV